MAAPVPATAVRTYDSLPASTEYAYSKPTKLGKSTLWLVVDAGRGMPPIGLDSPPCQYAACLNISSIALLLVKWWNAPPVR
ncbi:MAG: hypothetical protein K2W86_16315, partial [Sphingomonas sp.]|uniref:hypothetical protein n=1 Tax=Sphingomonas sp. TaxID=28214 RepID=UPI0035A990E1|nr:hypothetical protein [Sphingomonas sp.]